MKDPYKVLGIEKDAEPDQIKKAYYKLAHQTHPDKNQNDPDAEDKFKDISSAYDVLSNPDKRQQYDTYGDVGSINRGPTVNHPFSSIFEAMRNSGFGGQQGGAIRGADIRQIIKISFMKAVKGCSKTIKISYPVVCKSCDGSGAKDKTKIKTCTTCNGVGKVGQNLGPIQMLHLCPTCQGKGSIVTEKCETCHGGGQTSVNESIKVTIPKGIGHGITMRVAEKGMPSEYGAENGDLLLTIMVSAHPEFNRRGLDIYTEKTIDYLDAILGIKIPIKTVHGDIKLTIPPGTQPNNILKISGKGVALEKQKGDHMVIVHISIPKNISQEKVELLKQLKNIKD